MYETLKLIKILEQAPKSKEIKNFVKSAENESHVDLNMHSELLRGVWELRWSSSNLPFLNYSPFLDNLQILDPEKCRGLNFLRTKGLFAEILTAKIFSKLDIIDEKRLNVTFKKTGIIGPQIFGKNIAFFSEIKKTQKGWLDTTVLTNKLRVCRGYKGTTFALLKRDDFSIGEFF